jgi:hypothetical protein
MIRKQQYEFELTYSYTATNKNVRNIYIVSACSYSSGVMLVFIKLTGSTNLLYCFNICKKLPEIIRTIIFLWKLNDIQRRTHNRATRQGSQTGCKKRRDVRITARISSHNDFCVCTVME